jgi:THO complex subunit 1
LIIFFFCSPELTRLWNLCPDNLQACKGADRNFLPTLENYLESPKEKNDPSFEWRALRLLARQSPHFFTLFNSPSCKVTDYLDSVRKKIQKDKIDIKLEPQEEAANEEQIETENFEETEQMDSDLLKTEPLTQEEKNVHRSVTVSAEQLKELAPTIGGNWKKLAVKLGKCEAISISNLDHSFGHSYNLKIGYSTDEILFFETENPTVDEQCRTMLQIWFEDDMDASLDNLAYILEGLEMIVASEAVKRFIPVDGAELKVEEISD